MASLYPTALDTTDSLYTAVNGLLTTLTSDLSSVATTMAVKATAGSPATGVVTIKGEAIKYGSKTATSFGTLTRGFDGTSPAQHFNGDEVDFSPIADHHNSLVQAIFALEAKLGTGTGAVKSGANTLSWGTGVPNIVGIIGDVYVRTDGTPGLSTLYYCTVAGNPATFVAEDNLYVLKSTLTTDGDLYIRSAGAISRLPIGAANQVLTVVGGLPAWTAGTPGPPGPPGAGGNVSTGQAAVTIPGLAGSGDQKPAAPGASDDEFDTTTAGAIAGWTTTANVPTTINENTFAKSIAYVKKTLTGTENWTGFLKAAPALPYTMIGKVSFNGAVNFQTAGFVISDSPVGNGKGVMFGIQRVAGITINSYTTLIPAGGGAAVGAVGIASGPTFVPNSLYFKAVVTAFNNISYYYSFDGIIWAPAALANAFLAAATTVGAVVSSFNADTEAAFDFIRFS
jgi:hypothetical protein